VKKRYLTGTSADTVNSEMESGQCKKSGGPALAGDETKRGRQLSCNGRKGKKSLGKKEQNATRNRSEEVDPLLGGGCRLQIAGEETSPC